MTSEPAIGERQPVPVIPIKLPASVYQRFLAEVPPRDRHNFATCALIEALDRRTSSCAPSPEELQGQIMTSAPITESKSAGRPPKGAGRDRGTWYVEKPFSEAIKAESKRRGGGTTPSDILNACLAESPTLRTLMR